MCELILFSVFLENGLNFWTDFGHLNFFKEVNEGITKFVDTARSAFSVKHGMGTWNFTFTLLSRLLANTCRFWSCLKLKFKYGLWRFLAKLYLHEH